MAGVSIFSNRKLMNALMAAYKDSDNIRIRITFLRCFLLSFKTLMIMSGGQVKKVLAKKTD
jgi:hypothetical protein